MTPAGGERRSREVTTLQDRERRSRDVTSLQDRERRLRERLAALHALQDRLEIEQYGLTERVHALGWQVGRAVRRIGSIQVSAEEVAAHRAAALALGAAQARLVEVGWQRRQTAVQIGQDAQRVRAVRTALRLPHEEG